MGLGCGGASRLGILTGGTEAAAVGVVERALDLGINLIDTAELYGTEGIVGQAIQGHRRGKVVLSTKKRVFDREKGSVADAKAMGLGVERSLRRLKTDVVDIFHAHLVLPDQYAYVRDEIVPALLQLREVGKIRFLGITESFVDDSYHRMLEQALEDDCWDVVMAGFNLLNPSARMNILPVTQERDVGFLNMIAFRQAFGDPGYVRERLEGQDWMGDEPPLGFLTRDPDVESLVEAAYRFSRWEPGVHVVLSGTGNPAHLEANVQAMGKSALGERHLKRLEDLFALIGVKSYL